jgi:hypothetical protein
VYIVKRLSKSSQRNGKNKTDQPQHAPLNFARPYVAQSCQFFQYGGSCEATRLLTQCLSRSLDACTYGAWAVSRTPLSRICSSRIVSDDYPVCYDQGNVSDPTMAVSSDGPRPPNVDNLGYRSERYGMTYEMTSTAPALLFSAMKVTRVSTTLLILVCQ